MKTFNLGIAFSFRNLVHHNGGEYGNMHAGAGEVAEMQILIERKKEQHGGLL